MVLLEDLPRELIEQILVYADPVEVSKFSQTSRDMYVLVYGAQDQHLWRSPYLTQKLDDPRDCLTLVGTRADTRHIDWKTSLQHVILARSFIQSSSPDNVPENLRIRALEALVGLITQTPPFSDIQRNSTQKLSLSLLWVYDLLQGYAKCLDELFPVLSPTERQLRCQLYTYFGITVTNTCSPLKHVRSRAKTYDMRSYRLDNHFGPYLPHSDIPDWEQLLAIHHVMAMHIIEHGPDSYIMDEDAEEEEDVQQGWNFHMNDPSQFPHSLRNSQIYSAPVRGSHSQDWAGVEGRYLISFSFCDHESLIEYNNSWETIDGDLDVSIFTDPNFIEMYRTTSIELQITEVHQDGTPTPKISFAGILGLRRHANVTGTVQQTQNGHVRWSFVYGESNAGIWTCQGVQIGGVSSKYGALGIWSTFYHSEDDPIGPFWLRKVVGTNADDE